MTEGLQEIVMGKIYHTICETPFQTDKFRTADSYFLDHGKNKNDQKYLEQLHETRDEHGYT